MPANSRSYRNETFVIANSDARIRQADDLSRFVVWAAGEAIPAGKVVGDHKLIPDGATIKIDDTRLLPAGLGDYSLFVHALDAGGDPIGWTSAGNIKGKLIGYTVGERSPPNTSKTGPNAAWAHGTFIGQIDLVYLVGTGADIKVVAASMVDAFLAMADAARADGRTINVNSGFRNYTEQTYFYQLWLSDKKHQAQAAPPGASNHQSGIAFDLDVKPADSNPNYAWLKANATKFGFVRTVSKEQWHWEYQPDWAAAARAAGKYYRLPGGGKPIAP